MGNIGGFFYSFDLFSRLCGTVNSLLLVVAWHPFGNLRLLIEAESPMDESL